MEGWPSEAPRCSRAPLLPTGCRSTTRSWSTITTPPPPRRGEVAELSQVGTRAVSPARPRSGRGPTTAPPLCASEGALTPRKRPDKWSRTNFLRSTSRPTGGRPSPRASARRRPPRHHSLQSESDGPGEPPELDRGVPPKPARTRSTSPTCAECSCHDLDRMPAPSCNLGCRSMAAVPTTFVPPSVHAVMPTSRAPSVAGSIATSTVGERPRSACAWWSSRSK